MKKAIIKIPFTVVQWHGDEYPYYSDDAELNMFAEGDQVEVLKEVTPNESGRLFVVYNEKTNESSVISDSHLEFI